MDILEFLATLKQKPGRYRPRFPKVTYHECALTRMRVQGELLPLALESLEPSAPATRGVGHRWPYRQLHAKGSHQGGQDRLRAIIETIKTSHYPALFAPLSLFFIVEMKILSAHTSVSEDVLFFDNVP